ncbi:MAG TPA: DUF885 family protein, partial [Xanthomonadales bacterium]|nr:DUF885 family protein [Xanthomonadales bacterium]
MIRIASVLIALLLAQPLQAAQDSESFRTLYEQEWAFRLKEFPLLASGVGVHNYDDRLGRVSPADQQRRHAFWQDIRARLDMISCDRLERSECIDYRIFKRQVEAAITDYEIRAYLIPFNSDWGFYMAWTRLPDDTEFAGEQDYRNYLARLAELPAVMDEYIGLMREGLRTGMTQ